MQPCVICRRPNPDPTVSACRSCLQPTDVVALQAEHDRAAKLVGELEREVRSLREENASLKAKLEEIASRRRGLIAVN